MSPADRVRTPLAPAQLAEFRRALKRRFADLWQDVQRELARFDPDLYQTAAGEVHDLQDQATADLLVDVNLADVHRDIGEMRDIDAALMRIAERRYGICTDCRGEIGLERLRAYPTAKRCHACQRVHEATHLRKTGGTL